MKNEKRILSVLLAVILAFSMITPAFATLPSPGEVVGEGDIVGADVTDLDLSALVPTNANLNFSIDPYGLLDMTLDTVIDELVPVTNEVVFDNTPILNVSSRSARDLLLTVDLAVTKAENVEVVLEEAALTADNNEDAAILFWVEPNIARMDGTDDTTDDFVGFGRVIPFGEYEEDDEVVLSYRLPALPSRLRLTSVDPIELEEELVYTDDWVAVAFSFGGVFNQNADDWADVDVAIEVTFTVEALHANAAALAYVPGVFALLSAGTNVNGTDNVVNPTFINFPAIYGGTERGPGGPGANLPSATATLVGNVLTITGTNTNFGNVTRIEAYVTIGGAPATPNVANWAPSVTASTVTFTLPAAWTGTGANSGWRSMTISAGDYTIVIPRAAGSPTGNLPGVTVERS